jgi:hypothetical protein
MRHMDEGALQAWMDREVPVSMQAELRGHLDGCGACSAGLDRLRQRSAALSAALRVADVTPPMLPARQRIRAEARRRTLAARTAVLRRVALFMLVSAAAVSATVPGSPVREWLAGALGGGDAAHPPEPAIAAVETRSAAETPAGVSLLPGTETVRVEVSSPEPGLVVHVRMHDGERLGVWASGPAASARFNTARNRIEVVEPGPGELQVEIPRSAGAVTLDVDGRRYLEKRGDQLRFPGPGAVRSGPEIRFEVAP